MKNLLLILTTALSLPIFSQNVGIGTPTPQSKLHVAGCIRSDTLAYITPGVKTLFAAPNGRIYDSLALPSTLSWEINGNANITAINFLGTTNANDIIVKTNNIERMRVFSGGNFGFGITTPGVYLANTLTHPDDGLGLGTLVAKGMDWGVNGMGYVASFYNQDAVTAAAGGLLVKTANTSVNSKALSVVSGPSLGGNNLLTVLGNGQVGVGTATPDPSALMDLSTSNKGFLLPRIGLLSSSDILTIPSPVAGLQVYNTNTSATLGIGVVYFDGTRWVGPGYEYYSQLAGFTVLNSGALVTVPFGSITASQTGVYYGNLRMFTSSQFGPTTDPSRPNETAFYFSVSVNGVIQDNVEYYTYNTLHIATSVNLRYAANVGDIITFGYSVSAGYNLDFTNPLFFSRNNVIITRIK